MKIYTKKTNQYSNDLELHFYNFERLTVYSFFLSEFSFDTFSDIETINEELGYNLKDGAVLTDSFEFEQKVGILKNLINNI